MRLPKNEGGDFELPPPGTHTAICYRIIDLGTQQVEYMGAVKHQRKIMLSWELSDEMMKDGRPFVISQRYTFSTFDRAVFRQHLEAWRGKPFVEADFGPDGFDVKKLLGVPCLLGIVHKEVKDKTYANISSLSTLLKGQAKPTPINASVYFSLEPAEFNQATYESLSDNLRATIAKSPEYAEIKSPRDQGDPRDGHEPPPLNEHDGAEDPPF